MVKILCLVLALVLAGCSNRPAEPSGCSEASACEAGGYETVGMEEISFEDAIELFEDKESGLLYFGFPDCPWCMEAVPVLEEEADVPILYVRTRDDEKNRLYSDEQKERITPYIEDYMEKDDKGELALFVPLVLKVENGVVIAGHEGTVDGHDAHERKMSEEEISQLRAIYQRLLSA